VGAPRRTTQAIIPSSAFARTSGNATRSGKRPGINSGGIFSVGKNEACFRETQAAFVGFADSWPRHSGRFGFEGVSNLSRQSGPIGNAEVLVSRDFLD
jgi:hypothetical protein